MSLPTNVMSCFSDDARIGRGSERGDRNNWFYETYDLELNAGEHLFVARTWAFGRFRPWAQLGLTPGFLLAPEKEDYISLFGTGASPWEAKKLTGYDFTNSGAKGIGTGGKLVVDGTCFPWGFSKKGKARDGVPPPPMNGAKPRPQRIQPTITMPSVRPLCCLNWRRRRSRVSFALLKIYRICQPKTGSSPLNMTFRRRKTWASFLKGNPVTLPPRCRRRVIIDLENYYCVYPEVTFSGGRDARITLNWAESLITTDSKGDLIKTNRNEIYGKIFQGIGDTFFPDGGRDRKFDTLWWHAGRYLEVLVETGADSLTFEGLSLWETRYPLQMESTLHTNDLRFAKLVPVAFRAMRMCAHETYMDCPYWEQLMYVGDTRIQALVTYTTHQR